MDHYKSSDKKSVVVLEFVRAPYNKPCKKSMNLDSDAIKSCLLALLEKKPKTREALTDLVLASSTPGSLGDFCLEALCESLELDSSLIPSACYHGDGTGVKSFVLSSQKIEYGPASLFALGGLDLSFSSSPKKKSKNKVEMTKYKLRIKKSLPELLSLEEDDFLNTVGFKYADVWQTIAHKLGVTRQEQDRYSFESFQKFSQRDEENGIVPVFSKEPSFSMCKKDSFSLEESDYKSLGTQLPLLKGEFSSVTARNSSFFAQGISFLLLADRETSRGLGYKTECLFLDSEASQIEEESEAIQKLLKRNKLTLKEIDYFEISEISAAGALASLSALQNPSPERVNFFGGTLAYGYAPSSESLQMISNMKKVLELKKGTYGLVVTKSSSGYLMVLLFQRQEIR